LYVITFYSFKGGVGRTMALANVAADLVRRGRKVLVVDFDLEAPGLETYKHLRPQAPHPGIVEYVTEFRRNYEVPTLLDYIYETKPIGNKGGRLWVMPAGRRDRDYRNALVGLDWKRLYRDEGGFLLFEDTKKGWEEELNPDYVLIDSRTGDTDVLGICTRQLPDSVVLMFTPNQQNLVGLEAVCRDIRREEAEGMKKRIRLHFVAANVPDLDDENRILRRQIQTFRDRLEFEELSGIVRRYENLTLLDQTIFTIDRPHTRLARSYRRLLRALLKENLADRAGALLFLDDYPKQMKTRRIDTTLLVCRAGEDAATGAIAEHDKACLHTIVRHFDQDAEVLARAADCLMKEHAYKSACSVLDHLLRIDPNRPQALYQRALCNTNLFRFEEAGDDLITCLSAKAGPNLKAASLARLCSTHPNRVGEVTDILETQGFRELPLETVAHLLCRCEEGVPVAANLLRKHLGELSATGWVTLLKARCWKEVIQLKESGRLEDWEQVLFGLALAGWAVDGEFSESLCRKILEADPGNLVTLWGDQAIGWVLWRVGEVSAALSCLDAAEQNARVDSKFMDDEYEVFSLWRLRDVAIEQYLDDCRLVRRMFQGEPIRPAFLSLSHDTNDTNPPTATGLKESRP
jgi:MinD-like ATPase involved in chromosome partitioning or flagellar assembly